MIKFGYSLKSFFKIAMAGSMYMVGMFFGGAMIGRICDVFGRRFATTLSILIATAAHFGAGFSENYCSYVFGRFSAGVGRFIICFT